MTNVISVRTLRPRLSEVLDDVFTKFDRYVITKRGKPEAILISLDEYESLVETMEIQTDKDLLQQIKNARKEIVVGKGTSLKDFYKELGFV